MKPGHTLALALALGAAVSCNKTSGGLIDYLPVEVGGLARDAGGPMFFTTQPGWDVELDQAVIGVGPFYFNTQPPGTQGLQVGTFIIQITAQTFVNALDPTLYFWDAGANGETGSAASVQIKLYPPGCSGNGPSGDDDCTTDPTPVNAYTGLINEPPLFLLEEAGLASGSSAFAAGTAQQPTADGGTLVVPFYGFITIDQSTGGNPNDPAASPLATLQEVAGACPCAGGCSAAGGCTLDFTNQPSALQIRVDPTHWFNGVDFATLIPPTPACDAGTSDAGCPAGWTPDAGPLTWNRFGADSATNTLLVEQGLQSADGVYLFNLAPKGSN